MTDTTEQQQQGQEQDSGSASNSSDLLADPNWLTGEGADEGLNYCLSCAEKEAKKLGGECTVGGGYPQEESTPPQCEICFKPLAATLEDGTEIETIEQWFNEVRRYG